MFMRKIILHEFVCDHGHIKYAEYDAEICNICGNRNFTLVRKNAAEINKDGFTKTPRDDSNKE